MGSAAPARPPRGPRGWLAPLGFVTVVLGSAIVTAEPPSKAKVDDLKTPQVVAEEPKPIDPVAIETVARTRAYLASLGTYRVRAETTHDVVVGDGYKLQRAEVVDLAVHEPNRMRAEIAGDERNQILVDDGKTFSIYSRADKYYATMTAMPTLTATLDAASAHYGVVTPLADFIHMANGEQLAKDVLRARAIGPSTVAGVACDHLAFRGKELDWQVWIEIGDKPVPRKIVVTTRKAPEAPQYSAILEWEANPALDDSLFTFTPPSGAAQMALPRTKPAAKTK